MKKILYTILIALAIVINVNAKEVFYTNNNGIEITQEQYNNLKGLAYTDKQIAKMDLNTFNENKDITGTIVAQNVKHYIKVNYLRNGIEATRYEVVTEDQYNGRLKNPQEMLRVSGNYYDGLLATDEFAVVSSISNIDEDYMQYRVDVYNYEIPSTRSIDIYGVGIENNKVQVASIIRCHQSWEYTNGTDGYSEACYPKIESTGGSAMFELPSGSLNSLETYVHFRVSKLPSMGTIYTLEAVGDYAHANQTVSNSVYNYYTVNIGGINIVPPYLSSYDYQSTPGSAGFAGTW